MQSSPKVSFIIPVYNVEKYLRQCLDSVLNQTLKDFEVICVDDGSTDSSLEILREYENKDNRLKIVCQQNKGAGAARNLGMQYATGEYLFFMDSDDYCSLDFLEKTTKAADEKNTDILVFNFYKFNNADNSKELRNGLVKSRCPKNKDVFSYRDVPHYIALTVNPTPWNKLYRHSFVKETKLQWLETSTTNDITFATMSVLMADRIAYLEQPFIFYRVALNNSITSKKKYNQGNVIKAVLAVADQAKNLPHYEMIKNSVKEFVASNLRTALNSYTPDKDSAYYLKFARTMDSIVYSHPLFYNCTPEDFQDKGLYDMVIEGRSRAMVKDDFSYAPKIIVSFTSFPGRIATVYKTLASIYKQTMKPHKVILWLAESQFPNKEEDLPEDLLDYKILGLDIRWCPEDIRPHKKYFYAMQEYPEDLIITIDDDLTYDEYMIETLFTSYMHFPKAVSSVRAHLMTKDENGNIAPYADWIKEFSGVVGVPSMQLFSTSGAGTIYPPHCMDEEVFNIDNIKDLCLNADDLWLKVMQVRKGTPVVLAKKNKLLRYVQGTQDVALLNTNVHQNANDMQLQKTLSVYGSDCDIAERIFADNYHKNTVVDGFDVTTQNIYGTLASNSKYIEVSQQLESTLQELNDIKVSNAYKLSKIIDYVPRMLKKVVNSYRNNGFKYVVNKIFEKTVGKMLKNK